MSKFETKKVFDCQDMPEELRRKFFDMWDNKGNDSFVEWTIGDSFYEADDPSLLIEDWLLANGAADGEEVVIKYWW